LNPHLTNLIDRSAIRRDGVPDRRGSGHARERDRNSSPYRR
jgi:hypothetical protein